MKLVNSEFLLVLLSSKRSAAAGPCWRPSDSFAGRKWRTDSNIRILTFPPLLALLLALVLMPVNYPEWILDLLRRIGATLVPLALVSVGLQLRLDQIGDNVRPLVTSLAFKLLIGPALVAIIYVWSLHKHGETMRVTLFESAMGPQIGASIVASRYGLNPTLITLMVGVGTVLSFLSRSQPGGTCSKACEAMDTSTQIPAPVRDYVAHAAPVNAIPESMGLSRARRHASQAERCVEGFRRHADDPRSRAGFRLACAYACRAACFSAHRRRVRERQGVPGRHACSALCGSRGPRGRRPTRAS